MDPVHTAFLHTIVSGSQFTDEFGKVPELDFIETPVGMIYVATRRVGENIWARMVEIVLPNLQQVAPIWENGHREHPFSGPMMSRWIVPMDDTNTMFIEFRHVSETEGATPAWWADRDVMLPGQLPEPTPMRRASAAPETTRRRSDNGRLPSTAWSIWAPRIAASSCFGSRSGGVFAPSRQGRDPRRPVPGSRQAIIPTYCNDTIVRVPPGPTRGGGPATHACDGADPGRVLSRAPALGHRPRRTTPRRRPIGSQNCLTRLLSGHSGSSRSKP